MSYSVVPPKGEPTFCEKKCSHRDCKLWRAFFASKCAICGKGFEPGQKYCAVDIESWQAKKHAHQSCLLQKQEEQKQ